MPVEIKNKQGKVLMVIDRENLIDADLGHAKLEGADLRGANLSGAKIDIKYKDKLDLTNKQINKIIWIGE